jgi:hypothetical protein
MATTTSAGKRIGMRTPVEDRQEDLPLLVECQQEAANELGPEV